MRMQRLLFISLAALLILSLFRCNADKMELTNPNQLTPETYFKTEAQVQMAVNAVYAGLQTHGLYQHAMYYALDCMSMEQIHGFGYYSIGRDFFSYFFDANNGTINAYWKDCYTGINRANFVINNEDVINKIPDAFIAQKIKSKFIGEARFLRAFYCFLLVTRFGDVPLYLNNPQEGTGLPRMSKSQVWDQIESDLTAAAEKCLPKKLEEKGRVTSGAAWALLGKAYLFQANESNNQVDFLAAKDAFLKVIEDVENYRLEDIYSDNFKEETEHGPESIFEIEFNPKLGTDNMWSGDGSGLNEGNFRPMEYGCFNWHNVWPSTDLVEEFEAIDDNGIKTDPRLGYCIYQTGDLYNNGNDTAFISNNLWVEIYGVIYKTGWKKYQNYYKQESEVNNSGINTKVIRLADVLLMMAEVENELGHIPGAVDYINRVRNRADVMMPNYGIPAMDTVYPVANKEQIRKAIEHERKIELCNEQVRINDLIRWRRLEDFMRDEAIPALPNDLKTWIHFDPDKHYLWPIPQSEIDLNSNINQEDQNPGY